MQDSPVAFSSGEPGHTPQAPRPERSESLVLYRSAPVACRGFHAPRQPRNCLMFINSRHGGSPPAVCDGIPPKEQNLVQINEIGHHLASGNRYARANERTSVWMGRAMGLQFGLSRLPVLSLKGSIALSPQRGQRATIIETRRPEFWQKMSCLILSAPA